LGLLPAPAESQVVLPPLPAPESPWNAQRVFEPIPFAHQWESMGMDIAPEDMPVKTRIHPGWEPVGFRAGSWMFVPSFTFGSYYTSNAFSSATDRKQDFVMQVHPSLRAYSMWNRHSLAIQADVRSETYRENAGLNQTDASVKARGRIDLRHDMAILTDFRAALLHDAVGSLSSPAGAVEPTPYTFFSGDATYWQQFNRLSASVGARIDSYDYGTTRAANGNIISQDARDGQIYVGHGRAEYVFAPSFGVFAAAEGNRRELRGTATRSLSSEGYRALGGITVGLTRLLTGEIGVGYSDQRFDSSAIARVTGPAYRVLLTWSPTRTVDIKLKAESVVTQAVDTDATGIRADAIQLGVDYEFRRNVIASIAVIYEKDRFVGQFRQDNVHATLSELKYILNRHWSVSLRHQYTSRDSNIPAFVYDKHEIGINVTAQH
jgi:hypothetical protein